MVEFEGLDTIIKRLDELTDVKKVEQAINQGVLLVESSAKQNASNCKDTGALQNSIISTVETTNEAGMHHMLSMVLGYLLKVVMVDKHHGNIRMMMVIGTLQKDNIRNHL